MILERRGFVAAFPFVLAVLACGSEAGTRPAADELADSGSVAEQEGSGHGKLQVYGRDIVAGWANVSVLLDGVPVDDASVVVNGHAIPHASSEEGLYSGQLGAPLSAGDTVSLRVTRGHSKVLGTGTLPDSPVLTSPLPGATRAPGEDVAVTWTSVSEPDYFVVSAQWSCGPACGTGVRFDVDRSARAFTIPASSLPAGQDVLVTVFAYDDGKLHGKYEPYAPYPGMNVRAESNPVAVAAKAPGPKLQVYGTDMGAQWEHVVVTRDGIGVNDATVVVNGQVIARGAEYWRGLYSGMLPTQLPPGGALVLEVTSGSSVVTGVGNVPDSPVLAGPPDGTRYAPGDDIVVTWTSPSDPDYFVVNAQWSCGADCGTGMRFEADRAARMLTIPAGTLPSGREFMLSVFAYDDGTLGGDYDAYPWYPGMNIRAESHQVYVWY